jgi:hypothetical protein
VYGWIPLGWGDRYVPWWGRRECGERCWTHYNRPYAVNRAERGNAQPTRYSNVGVPGAITAVAGATLVGAKPVASNLVRLPPQIAATAPVLALAPAVKPLRIPAAAPRMGSAPAPASTFYPASRPALTGMPTRAAPAVSSGAVVSPGPSRSLPVPARVAPTLAPVAPDPVATATGAAPAANVVKPHAVDRNARVNSPVPATPETGARVVAVPPPRAEASAPMRQHAVPENLGLPMPPARAQQVERGPTPQPMYPAPAQPAGRSVPVASPGSLPAAPGLPHAVAPAAAAPTPQGGGQANVHAAPASDGSGQVAPAKPVAVVPPVPAGSLAK